ncbi:MAG: hypothetical protein GX593_12690 [Actinomycetales bacterium]|nr:hypothetical protein [Actinomycetales bacterium]
MSLFLTNEMRARRAAELGEAYRTHRGAVVFLDETFSLQDPRDRFYAVTASVVSSENLDNCRQALLTGYDADPIHASELYKHSQSASLTKAIDVVAAQRAMHCIVVRTDVERGDQSGDGARRACFSALVPALGAGKTAATLFVADSRGTLAADRVDSDLVRQLRVEGKVPRGVTLLHRMPSEEQLIALADVTGWAWRQRWLRTSQSHRFDPLEDRVQVQVVSGIRAN